MQVGKLVGRHPEVSWKIGGSFFSGSAKKGILNYWF